MDWEESCIERKTSNDEKAASSEKSEVLPADLRAGTARAETFTSKFAFRALKHVVPICSNVFSIFKKLQSLHGVKM